ncbi:MAG: hypothetical protein DRP64_20595 [Verrucomicrobia bacterium]|nr:MAG: hypothetical protein DRP64_20595 [Verrucomicrobiota bacterium]
MKLNKIIVIVVVMAVVAFFLMPGKYKKSIYFQGQDYEYAYSDSTGDIKNYFYTVLAVDPGKASAFIQLVVFNDDANDDYVLAIYNQVRSTYKLKSLYRNDNKLFGKMDDSVYVYAHKDDISRTKSIAIYTVIDGSKMSEAKAKSKKYLSELQLVQQQLINEK